MTTELILYAPNVHTGGGGVLLQALLSACPKSISLTAFLDARARDQFSLPQGAKVFWVTASVGSRLSAEFNLHKVSRDGVRVLCFHGLPPLFPNSAHNHVFLQNRLYLGFFSLMRFKFKTQVRLAFERFVSQAFRHRVSEYIVQTPSMQRAVMKWYGEEKAVSRMLSVRVMPFVDEIAVPVQRNDSVRDWDFIYVADGEAHKNHVNLLEAWRLLANDGLRPSLVLTLGKRDEALWHELEAVSARQALRISNLGYLPREKIIDFYHKAKALIFPSTTESFGLPLIEATVAGLPILASELDYVRDVCVPVQTFDPHSPVSIARAVKRFLGQPNPTVELHTPAEFWSALLEDE